MIINNFIYFYIGVCILLIVFEIIWKQYIRIRDIKIRRITKKYKNEIENQINQIKTTDSIKREHAKMLNKELKRVDNLIAFENACDQIIEEENIAGLEAYMEKIVYTFFKLALYYSSKKNEMEKAYFAYIIGTKFKKIDVIENPQIISALIEILYKLLQSKNINCRINAMEAICRIGKTEHILKAVSIINRNNYTYSQVLLSNQLNKVESDRYLLALGLFNRFEKYNKTIQIAIIKFLSEARYVDEDLLIEKLKNNNTSVDARCEIMRYFQKNKNEKVKQYLLEMLQGDVVPNDINIKAIGTLGYYGDEEVYKLLNLFKESSNELIKESAHRSLEKIEKLQNMQTKELV